MKYFASIGINIQAAVCRKIAFNNSTGEKAVPDLKLTRHSGVLIIDTLR